MTKLTINVDGVLKTKLKVACAQDGKEMTGVLITLIEGWLKDREKRQQKPRRTA